MPSPAEIVVRCTSAGISIAVYKDRVPHIFAASVFLCNQKTPSGRYWVTGLGLPTKRLYTWQEAHEVLEAVDEFLEGALHAA